MSITIAGAFIAVYVLLIIFTCGRNAELLLIRLFTLNLIYEGFINVGYFITVGGQLFKVADFLQFICVFISVGILLRKGTPSRLVGFILAIILSVVMLLIHPYGELVRTFNGVDFVNNLKYMHYPSFDLQTVKTSVRLICFTINGTAVALCLDAEKWNFILNKYLKFGRLVIGYAWIEFFLKNILHVSITQNIIQFVFGSDTSIMTSLVRNGLRVVIGLNNEPSQFCMMLYSYLIIYIISKSYLYQTRGQNRLTTSGFVLMLLCGSFRAVGLLPILLILYLIVSNKPIQGVVITFLVSIAIMVLSLSGALDYYYMRLGNAISFVQTLDATIAGGEAGRLNTIVEAMSVFLKRPLLGIGPGQTFAYGFIPSMLAMTGLLGLVTWYKVIFGAIGNVSKTSKTDYWFLIITAISISWIYNDSIAIGYSIYVLAIAYIIRFCQFDRTVSISR